jgi:hypothetical protein
MNTESYTCSVKSAVHDYSQYSENLQQNFHHICFVSFLFMYCTETALLILFL